MDNHDLTDPAIPRIELRDPAATEIAILGSLQRVLLKHPVACQAAFTALLAEGRRFGNTAEGHVWRQRLVNSSLLQRARLVFDLSTLSLLEEGEANHIPSAYLDAIFLAASGGDADQLLDRLFWKRGENDAHSDSDK
jgi:hypothetical protein